MTDYWVLVADENHARLFSTGKIRSELNEIEILSNPDARAHERDLVSEDRGRGFDRRGNGRHAMEPQTSARRQAAIRFAKTIAERLERGAEQHDYDRLIIVAPPEMLGLLRRELDQNARGLLHREISKDLVRATPKEVLEHLAR